MITTKTWTWRNWLICYQSQGEQGPPVILIHGFGASWGHWRKNIPVLAASCRCYAIDLLGFGGSAKPPQLKMLLTHLKPGVNKLVIFVEK